MRRGRGRHHHKDKNAAKITTTMVKEAKEWAKVNGFAT
jgi:hypothetical protein